MMGFLRRMGLRKWWPGRPAPMTREELLQALAVPEDHRVLRAVRCVLRGMELEAQTGAGASGLSGEERAFRCGAMAYAAEAQDRIDELAAAARKATETGKRRG